jgi:hypothetical protein
MTGDVFPFFSPVALSVSGIASVLLTATYILLALLMIRKVIQKSMGIPLKLLTLLFILSTILFYSVAWKSEAARSLSPTLPIFCFLILYIFRKNSEISITDLLNNKEKLKNYVAISILPFVIIASLMTINRVPERTFQLTDTISACEPTEFVFNGKTLSLTSIDEINTSRVFGWSRLINQLPDGYLIQGIAHLENKPFAVTGFVPKSLPNLSTKLTLKEAGATSISKSFPVSATLVGVIGFTPSVRFTSIGISAFA